VDLAGERAASAGAWTALNQIQCRWRQRPSQVCTAWACVLMNECKAVGAEGGQPSHSNKKAGRAQGTGGARLTMQACRLTTRWRPDHTGRLRHKDKCERDSRFLALLPCVDVALLLRSLNPVHINKMFDSMRWNGSSNGQPRNSMEPIRSPNPFCR
jgi:hypothetical protein